MAQLSWVYRLIFSAYYAGGFCLISYYVNFWGKTNFNIQFGTPIEYPFGSYAAVVAMVVIAALLFILCFVAPHILSRFKISNLGYALVIYHVLLFYMAIGISLLFFGLDIFFVVDGLIYGVMLGLMDGLRYIPLDFSYLDDSNISESVKIFKLNVTYDKWFRGLSIYTALLIATIIGGGLQWIISSPQEALPIISTCWQRSESEPVQRLRIDPPQQ